LTNVKSGIAWQERALDFFICWFNKKTQKCQLRVKPELLVQIDLPTITETTLRRTNES